MINCEISVIIPVYQIGIAKLERAVTSVLRDNCIRIEILLICNGTGEEVKQYCREKCLKEKRMKLYELDEANVSKARNLGIRKASGKYIGFVDADDYVENDMFSILYKDAMEEDADLVICDYFREQENKHQREQIIEKLKKGIQANNLETIDCLMGNEGISMMGSVWRSLCRRDFLLVNNIKFDPLLTIGEDFFFIVEVLNKNALLYIEHRALYHYSINLNSASMLMDEKKWWDYECFLKKLIEYTENNLDFKRYSCQIEKRLSDTATWIANMYINSNKSFQKKVQLVSIISRSKRNIERNLAIGNKSSLKCCSSGFLLFFINIGWSRAAVLYGLTMITIKRWLKKIEKIPTNL